MHRIEHHPISSRIAITENVATVFCNDIRLPYRRFVLSKIPVLGRLDPFLLAILATVAVAALLPADGVVLDGVNWAAKIAIGCCSSCTARACPRRRPSRVSSTGVCT